MVTIENKYGERMRTALIKKYEAEIEEAESTLEMYFNNMVGIGEHSDMLEEFDKWTEKLANANDKLETVKSFEVKSKVEML